MAPAPLNPFINQGGRNKSHTKKRIGGKETDQKNIDTADREGQYYGKTI